jgi:hypothetical protein
MPTTAYPADMRPLRKRCGGLAAVPVSTSAFVAIAICVLRTHAYADSNDLVLSRLATRVTDSSGALMAVIPQNREFRALASQLGVVLAPRMMTPADTLGFGGFQFAVDTAWTSIDSKASYWRALAGSRDPTGEGGVAHGPGQLSTVGFFARKGMWFPLPSFELGAGAILLSDSRTWAAQFSAKFAIAEGYHDLPVPSIAVRGSVSRMMHQRELDLTVPAVDVVVSKHIGIAGTWSIDPFAGWNLLLIVPRSEVLDPTPGIDPLLPGNQADLSLNFVFKDQALILRQRISGGAKFKFSFAALTIEAQYALPGSSVDNQPQSTTPCELNSMTTACDAKDSAKSQLTISAAAALDF